MSGKVKKFAPPPGGSPSKRGGAVEGMMRSLGPGAVDPHSPHEVLRFLSERLGKLPSPAGCGITSITVQIRGLMFGAQFVVIAPEGRDHAREFAQYIQTLVSESRRVGLEAEPGDPVEQQVPTPGGLVLPRPNIVHLYPFNVTPLKKTPEH